MKTIWEITDKLKKLRAKYKDVRIVLRRAEIRDPRSPGSSWKMDRVLKDDPTIDP